MFVYCVDYYMSIINSSINTEHISRTSLNFNNAG